jgi:hypothetical protein
MTTPAYTDLMRVLDRLNKVKLDFDERAVFERVAAYATEEPAICAYALAVLLLRDRELKP